LTSGGGARSSAEHAPSGASACRLERPLLPQHLGEQLGQLLRIEEELGKTALYPGLSAFAGRR
jgi:hypothetical protein